MPINTLDHVNIRTDKLQATYAFYGDLLGLVVTPPPGCADVAMGAWLCDRGQRAVLHVASIDAAYGDGQEGTPAGSGGGAIHHVAFDCSDYDAMYAHILRGHQVLRLNEIPSIGLRQIFLKDPNGILVELNFR